MVDATKNFHPAAVEDGDAPDERLREERKRYTTQLQRRAQAHVTAELGGKAVEEDTDRQVTMLVQHALSTTGGRRATLFRPVPRGRRWHVATALDDGSFYYGLVAPETLALSMVACDRKSSVTLSVDHSYDPALPQLSELGLKSYLGVPIILNGNAVAVIEAVDVAQIDDLDRHAATLEQAAVALADRLASEGNAQTWNRSGGGANRLGEQTVLDLVLRLPVEIDDGIEVSPAEWSILHQLNGERTLGTVAQASGMTYAQVDQLATALLDRGLARIGKENRRRV